MGPDKTTLDDARQVIRDYGRGGTGFPKVCGLSDERRTGM